VNNYCSIKPNYLKNQRRIIKIILLLFFSMTASQYYAQEIPELNTDRPDQTESPIVVPFDALQIETGFVYQKQKFSEESVSYEKDNLVLASTLCRYGVNSFMELRFGGEYFSGQTLTAGIKSNLQGVQNILFGTKLNFRKDENYFSNVGIIIQAIIPFGNAELRPDKFKPTFLLAVDQKINNNISLGCNLGAENEAESEKYNFVYTASLAIDLDTRLGSFFEFYGSALKHSSASNNFDCGLTYLIRKNVQIDFSLGTTLIKETTDYFGNIGFSIRLPK
jgi:hypothetical protein